MQTPVVEEGLPIAMFLSLAVISVQSLTGHDETLAIGDYLTQQTGGVENRGEAFLKTVLEVDGLQPVSFPVASPTFPLTHVVDKRLHRHLILAITESRSVLQIVTVIHH